MIAMKSREFFVCVLLYRAIRKAYIIKAKKRSPINSKAEGKKKKCPGNEKVQKTYKFEGAEKKECPREVFSLLLRHSAFVK